MYRNVVRYVMHCRDLNQRLVPIPPAIAPFHRIGIDLLGRFPKSAHGNKWIIVCTLNTIFFSYNVYESAKLLLDEIAKFLLEEIVLRQIFTTAYHPQTNGTDGALQMFNKTLYLRLF
ncbi:transposon Tf2-6 polyprotein [Trichonephila clavipes]|nr:transposon Tf2-6 polyprotein [Trichonephila clavipes]